MIEPRFSSRVYIPGVSSSIVSLCLSDEEFDLVVPSTWDLLDIAATYNWRALLPGSLVDDDAERMWSYLADRNHPLTSKRLHVVVQSLGLYLYGFPFFASARALGTLMHYHSVFRMWSVSNLTMDLSRASAAEWTAAAVVWQVQSGGQKEEERKAAWASLTIPSRLPDFAPGVSPDWMSQ